MRKPTVEEINEAIDTLESAGTVVSLGFWTTGTYARDASGVALPPYDKSACAWCGAGALYEAAGALNVRMDSVDIARSAMMRRLRAVTGTLPRSLMAFNDEQMSHEPVAQLMFDAADDLRERLSSA